MLLIESLTQYRTFISFETAIPTVKDKCGTVLVTEQFKLSVES